VLNCPETRFFLIHTSLELIRIFVCTRRFCTPAEQCPIIDCNWQSPEGVPVDAILFGGRRPKGVPLVYEAFDWKHGVFIGASMKSEATAAAEHKEKVIMHDPFAMRPFFGYNFGHYLQHWLSMETVVPNAKLPKIYHVNWFRKNDQASYSVWLFISPIAVRRCGFECQWHLRSRVMFDNTVNTSLNRWSQCSRTPHWNKSHEPKPLVLAPSFKCQAIRTMDLNPLRMPIPLYLNVKNRLVLSLLISDSLQGKFMWPGYGENCRVLDWILRRIDDEPDTARRTAIGNVPTRAAFNMHGLRVDYDGLFSVPIDFWTDEVSSNFRFISTCYQTFVVVCVFRPRKLRISCTNNWTKTYPKTYEIRSTTCSSVWTPNIKSISLSTIYTVILLRVVIHFIYCYRCEDRRYILSRVIVWFM